MLLDEHWRTQARMGAEVSAASLGAWSRVSPVSLRESGNAWLAFMLSLIRRERSRSRRAAASFYRLNRALETGHTFPPLDGDHVPDVVALGELREEWAQHTNRVRTPEPDDHVSVTVEDFDWPDDPEDDHDRAAVASLISTGPARVHQELERLESRADDGGRLDDAGFLADLDDLMARAGTTAAGAADREVLRGGRDLINRASQADRRAVGWARVTDGDPCAWCAMLASRGAVYRSRAVAGIRGLEDGDLPAVHRDDLEKYHSNCHCQTVPVYSRNDHMTPQARDYHRQWRQVTRGTTGAETLRVWRRHIDAQRRG
ncbi:hypothetical protein [Streptomyces sp. NPDC045470]|uniref:VG15 protein n=1 Tax=Streptomyces sp. NPDC045470 TaxID=3155469 RepID=UPI0033E627E7